MQGARVCFQPPEPFPAEVDDELLHQDEQQQWPQPESADVVRIEDVAPEQQQQHCSREI